MNEYKQIILVGYSGHAYVAAEVIIQNGVKLVGYLEKEQLLMNPYNLEYLGYEGDKKIRNKINNYGLFPSIGSNIIRRKTFSFLHDAGFHFIIAIHPKANVSLRTEIGEGTLICQGANINPLTKIGKAVIVNTGAIIEHECNIGDFTHIAPGAVLAGKVFVGENSFVGANAFVKQGVTIGKNVIVGAGAVVLRDLTDNKTYVGNPANVLLK